VKGGVLWHFYMVHMQQVNLHSSYPKQQSGNLLQPGNTQQQKHACAVAAAAATLACATTMSK